MTESELGEARRTIERLEAELALTKDVQKDLWAHEIYIKARRKMTIAVFAILGLLSALGLFTAYDIYLKLTEFSVELANNAIEKGINAKVDEMVSNAEPALREKLDTEIGAVVEVQKTVVQNKIATLNKQVSAAESAAQRAAEAARQANDVVQKANNAAENADYAAKRLKQITLAAAASEEPLQEEDVGPVEAATGCDPMNLTDGQRANLRIRQDSKKTDRVARNNLPYYTNAFTVSATSEDGSVLSPSMTACVVEAVDRVVYNLNKRWFSPSEIVKVNRSDRFSVSLQAWGPTEINASIYLRGERDAIKHHGSFMTALGQQYLAVGPRDPQMRGDRPD